LKLKQIFIKKIKFIYKTSLNLTFAVRVINELDGKSLIASTLPESTHLLRVEKDKSKLFFEY